MAKTAVKNLELPALVVSQWLDEWNEVVWDAKSRRRQPEHQFYQFAVSAKSLKALSGIYARTTAGRVRGAKDLGIQRRHEEDRSDEIGRFVRFGYPWSDLSKAKRQSGEFSDLRKPGWLPTAIVVNILRADDERLGKKVDKDDLVMVRQEGGRASIRLPPSFTGPGWMAKGIPPIEVIDGQHRLWAFAELPDAEEFQLPVVAFHGLDLSWQAYLFYTINIKPKKINASLAFDLYPLLRTEDWLERFEGHVIYRETRAQELVDILWSHPSSPWYQRINMLGESGGKGLMVSQAAWVRSLLASCVKSWEASRIPIGGLFGAPVGSDKLTLPWSRAEQSAFIILAGQLLMEGVAAQKAGWVKVLRKQEPPPLFEDDKRDLAFFGPNTLLNQDQGVRAFLHVINDLCYVRADILKLANWGQLSDSGSSTEKAITEAIASLRKHAIGKYLSEIAAGLAGFDWRASEAPELTEQERLLRAAFRGSGGYKELRRQLLIYLAESRSDVAKASREVLAALGYA